MSNFLQVRLRERGKSGMQFQHRRAGETGSLQRIIRLRKLCKDYVKNSKWRNLNFSFLNWKSVQQHMRSTDWTFLRQPRFLIAASTATAFLTVSGGYIQWNVNHTDSWNKVFTNGTYVGMVPSDSKTVSAIEQMADAYSVQLSLVPVHRKIPANYDWYTVTQLPEKAYAVTLNSKPLVYTSTPQDANNILRNVKNTLTPKGVATDAKVHFNGTVGVRQTIVGVADILSVETAVKYILHPSQSTAVGRSVNPLNEAEDLSSTGGLLPAGAKPAVPFGGGANETGSQKGPLLTVMASEVVTRKVKLQFPVKKVKDRHLGAGKIKITKKGVSGIGKERVRVTFKNNEVISNDVLSKVVLSQPKEQIENEGTNSGVATGSWSWPTIYYDITSPYGPRHLNGSYDFHPGVDIGCPVGTPIYATNNGVVQQAGWNSGGYGNWVLINNGRGIQTVFGHMSKVVAHAGETVAKGDLIGYSGDTGFVTGPHLHYEVRRNGRHINPKPYM